MSSSNVVAQTTEMATGAEVRSASGAQGAPLTTMPVPEVPAPRRAQLEYTAPSEYTALAADRHVGVRRVLTYGTFDLLHYGHIRLLQRAAALGDYLIVAISTDEFNAGKGKKSFYPYEVRREMLEAVRYVDLVIPEQSWEQKIQDIKDYHVDVVVMGSDWAGSPRFEYLRDYCDLVYLDRTGGISTTEVKGKLAEPDDSAAGESAAGAQLQSGFDPVAQR